MRRRQFIAALSVMATWPLAVHAQRPDHIRRIGVLMSGTENPLTRREVAALQKGCEDLGWTSGRNAQIEVRWSSGDVLVMRNQAAELVAWSPDVVVTQATPATLAFRETTRSIANVFVGISDPIGDGIAESISHPGGNSTGFINQEPTIGGKWLELLREVAPQIKRVAMLLNPKTFSGETAHFAQSAARSFDMTVIETPFVTAEEIESIFEALSRDPNVGLLVMPDASTNVHSALIIKMARRYRMVTVYPYLYYVKAGGLLSYGTDLPDQYRKAAGYVDRILRGERPGDLPIQAPSKYELAVNLKTAKELGIAVPPLLIARADEVIE